MKLDNSIPIIPTVVTENTGVEEALDTLLNLLYGEKNDPIY
jgi:hypothetical protein